MTKSNNSIDSVVNVLQEVRNNEYVKNIDLFEHDFQRIIDRLRMIHLGWLL